MPDLMTARELAQKVGWHPATVYNRRHAGLPMPPAIKLGNGALRFREEDVEAWLDAQTEQVPEPATARTASRSVTA